MKPQRLLPSIGGEIEGAFAWTDKGQVPGPTIRVTEGDRPPQMSDDEYHKILSLSSQTGALGE